MFGGRRRVPVRGGGDAIVMQSVAKTALTKVASAIDMSLRCWDKRPKSRKGIKGAVR
jgi:hypothetical protein